MTAAKLRFGIAALSSVVPTVAAAHAPVPGVGAFWNGVLHPMLVPVHLLVLLMAGAALGQNAPQASRFGLPLFAVALGLAVAFAPTTGVAQPILFAVALAAGLIVALGRGDWLAIAAALAAGLVVGLDSAPANVAANHIALAAAGTVCGGVLLVVLSGGAAAALSAPWQRIAVRTAGSWIAAVSLLVLAFVLSAQDTGL